jgi:hypothetical protein
MFLVSCFLLYKKNQRTKKHSKKLFGKLCNVFCFLKIKEVFFYSKHFLKQIHKVKSYIKIFYKNFFYKNETNTIDYFVFILNLFGKNESLLKIFLFFEIVLFFNFLTKVKKEKFLNTKKEKQ